MTPRQEELAVLRLTLPCAGHQNPRTPPTPPKPGSQGFHTSTSRRGYIQRRPEVLSLVLTRWSLQVVTCEAEVFLQLQSNRLLLKVTCQPAVARPPRPMETPQTPGQPLLVSSGTARRAETAAGGQPQELARRGRRVGKRSLRLERQNQNRQRACGLRGQGKAALGPRGFREPRSHRGSAVTPLGESPAFPSHRKGGARTTRGVLLGTHTSHPNQALSPR